MTRCCFVSRFVLSAVKRLSEVNRLTSTLSCGKKRFTCCELVLQKAISHAPLFPRLFRDATRASPLPGHFANLLCGNQLSDPIRLRAPKLFETLPGGKLVTWRSGEGHSHVIIRLFDATSLKLSFTCQTQFTEPGGASQSLWRCEQ